MNVALLAARRRSVPRPNLMPAKALEMRNWYHEGLPPELRTYGHPAPDGSRSAVKLVEDAANSQHYVFSFDTPSVPRSTPLTYSVYLKYAGRQWVRLNLQYYWTPHIINFNLLTGEVRRHPDRNGQPRSHRVQSLPGGWWRVSVMDNNQVGDGVNCALHLLDDALNPAYTGDGVSGIYAWGPMLNVGSVPSPFTTQGVSS